MTATLLPNAEQTFLDSNGKPLAGGMVYFYIPNTSTLKNTYEDAAQTILNTNPVVLDAGGRAIIYGTGVYRQVVYDQFGNLVWDQLTADTSGGLLGNITDNLFHAGTDFTPGTTTQLTLTAGPGSISNTWIYFDGTYQDDSQSAVNGTTLTFNSPIPVGVNVVTVKIGNAVTIGTPGAGTVTDDSVAPNAGIKSSKLSFLQAGSGAVARTVQSKLRDVVSVMDFGAKGDGTTDDTAAMQAAHNTGRLVYYPAGTYKFTTISLAAGGIVGDGTGQTILQSSDTSTSNLITYTGNGINSGPIFRDLQLAVGTYNQKTSGFGIAFIPGAAENQNALLDNVMVVNLASSVLFAAASSFTCRSCKFINYTTRAIQVQNSNNADSGDSFIEGCFFNTALQSLLPASQLAAIEYNTSGGLKVWGNKILGGNIGVLLTLTGSTNTGDLIVTGNSIEVWTFGVLLQRAGGATATFHYVQINDNQIALGQGANGVGINSTDASGFVSQVTIEDNVVAVGAASQDCVALANLTGFIVGGNILNGNGFSTTVGISVVSSCAAGFIDPNIYLNLTTPLSNGATGVAVTQKILKGTVAVTCSTSVSGMFTGSSAISFPASFFGATPKVMATASVGTTPITANAINVSVSGATIDGFAAINGAAINVDWVAMADY